MGRSLPAAISLALGALIVLLAAPRTFAALVGLGADRALYEASWGRTPEDGDVVEGIEALSRAIDWVPSATRLINLGMLEQYRASSLSPGLSDRTVIAEHAELHLLEGLKLNPADGTGLFRLALARRFLDAPPRAVATCLILSLDMAPNMRPLWLPRARMLLAHWFVMTVEEQQAIRRQLHTIWNAHESYHKPLVRIARETRTLVLLQWAIGNEPDGQAEFRKLMGQ